MIALASLAESTVVPVPIETAAVPLMASRPERALRVASAIILGSVVGSVLMYLAAYGLQDAVAPLAEWLGGAEAWARMRDDLSAGDLFVTVALVSVSFAPLQLAALGAGAAGGNFAVFVLAIALSRAVRTYGLALACRAFGRRIEGLGRSPWMIAGGALLGVAAIWAVARLFWG